MGVVSALFSVVGQFIPPGTSPQPIPAAQETLRASADLKDDDFEVVDLPLTDNRDIKALAEKSDLVRDAYQELERESSPAKVNKLAGALVSFLPLHRPVTDLPEDPKESFLQTRGLFKEAIEQGMPGAALTLLDQGLDLASVSRKALEQATCIAGAEGREKLLKRLLQHDKSLVNAHDNRGTSLLTATLSGGRKQLVEGLLDSGAAVGKQEAIAAVKQTAHGSSEVEGKINSQLLVRILNKVSVKEMSFELMAAAVESQDPLNIQLLYQRGADVNASKDGQTPLHLAAQKKHWPITNQLIELGTDLDTNAPLLQAFQVKSIAKSVCSLSQIAGFEEQYTEKADEQASPAAKKWLYEHRHLWMQPTDLTLRQKINQWKPVETKPRVASKDPARWYEASFSFSNGMQIIMKQLIRKGKEESDPAKKAELRAQFDERLDQMGARPGAIAKEGPLLFAAMANDPVGVLQARSDGAKWDAELIAEHTVSRLVIKAYGRDHLKKLKTAVALLGGLKKRGATPDAIEKEGALLGAVMIGDSEGVAKALANRAKWQGELIEGRTVYDTAVEICGQATVEKYIKAADNQKRSQQNLWE